MGEEQDQAITKCGSVVLEAFLEARARVIVPARLDDLRPFLSNLRLALGALGGRWQYGPVSWDRSLYRRPPPGIRDWRVAGLPVPSPRVSSLPYALHPRANRIGRWPAGWQSAWAGGGCKPPAFRRRRRRRAAMRMGFAIGDRPVDGLARAPVHVLPREPVVRDVHLIECLGQTLPSRCDRNRGPGLWAIKATAQRSIMASAPARTIRRMVIDSYLRLIRSTPEQPSASRRLPW